MSLMLLSESFIFRQSAKMVKANEFQIKSYESELKYVLKTDGVQYLNTECCFWWSIDFELSSWSSVSFSSF